jgi:hypothetical protein
MKVGNLPSGYSHLALDCWGGLGGGGEGALFIPPLIDARKNVPPKRGELPCTPLRFDPPPFKHILECWL